MARYGTVYARFWDEARRLNWDDPTIALALYFQTCRHRSTEGFYLLPLPFVAHERNLSRQRVEQTLDTLSRDGFVAYDDGAEVVFLVDALRDGGAPRGVKQVQGAINRLAEVPDSVLRRDFMMAAQLHAGELAEALAELPDWPRCPISPVSDTPSGESEIPLRWGISRARENSNSISNSISNDVELSQLDRAREARERERRERAERRARERTTIFATWVEITERDPTRTRFSPERRRLIDRALDNYPFEDVLAAIKGWRRIEHNRGQNDRGRPYNDLELLLRDSRHIERFRDAEIDARSQRARVPRRNLTAAELRQAEEAAAAVKAA